MIKVLSDAGLKVLITLDDVYPGMETVDEIVNIENKGDSDARLRYEIVSARILDNDLSPDTSETVGLLEDNLSHGYPFHVNIDLSKDYPFDHDIFDYNINGWIVTSIKTIESLTEEEFEKMKISLEKSKNIKHYLLNTSCRSIHIARLAYCLEEE